MVLDHHVEFPMVNLPVGAQDPTIELGFATRDTNAEWDVFECRRVGLRASTRVRFRL